MSKQKVMLTIEVPQGEYCWPLGETNDKACRYLNTAHGICTLDIGNPIEERCGYLKPVECRELVIVDEAKKSKPTIQLYTEAWAARRITKYAWCNNCSTVYLDDSPFIGTLVCPGCEWTVVRGIDKSDLPEGINANTR